MKVYLVTKQDLRELLRSYTEELEEVGDLSANIDNGFINDTVKYWARSKKSLR